MGYEALRNQGVIFVLTILLLQTIPSKQEQCTEQQQNDEKQEQEQEPGPQQQRKCQHLSLVESSDEAIFHIIGFVPVLNEYPSDLIDTGVMRSEIIRYTVQKFNKRHKRSVIGYTIYDTCSPHEYDRSITTEAVVNVVLNSPTAKIQVRSRNASTNDECLCVDDYQSAPLRHTLGIVGPALSTKSKLVNKLLSYTRLPMISYSATSPELSDEEKYPHFYRTILSDTYQAKAVQDLLQRLKWTYISILNSDDSYGRGGAHELSTAENLCIHHRESLQFPLNDSAIGGVMERLKSNTKSNAIIIWGHFNLVQSVLKKAAEHGVENKTWILSEASRRHPWFVSCDNKLKGSIINVVVNGGQYGQFEQHFFNLTYETTQNPWVRTFFRREALRNTTTIEAFKKRRLVEFRDNFELKDAGYIRNAVTAYLRAFKQYARVEGNCDISSPTCKPPPIHQHKEFSKKYIQQTSFKGLLNETISFSHLTGDAVNGRYDLYEPIRSNSNNKWEQFKLIAYWTSENGLTTVQDIATSSVYNKKSQCSDTCGPGTYPDYTEIVKKCCWECILCKIDYIKPNRSNENCTPCPPEHGSNNLHTECIPFTSGYVGYHTTESYAIYAVSAVGLAITLSAIALFVVARNTRIVRTMNLYPSLTQLLIHLLLFLLPYLFLEDNTEEKCVARTFGVGILFSLIVGITLAKVTHITSLFQFKRRIRRKDLIQLNTIQAAIIVVSLAVSVFLQVILMEVEPIKILRAHEEGTSAVTNDCHIRIHLAVQLVYILLLQIVCCIQAFRARKLPAAFNETKFIAFAMFTSTVVMVLTIPVHESHDKARDKNFIICIAILVANMLILLMLYSYKVLLICQHVRENGLSEGRKFSVAILSDGLSRIAPSVGSTRM